MVMIAEKLWVLLHVLVGGWKSTPPPCSLHTVLQAAAYRVNSLVSYILGHLQPLGPKRGSNIHFDKWVSYNSVQKYLSLELLHKSLVQI